ncbi:hypothetical protein HU200_022783 [Digitaria exilis]|uniref:TF-B3 domain-containing protein n=1 Tax=Digitaria exilis TaxID=1010633 RepID=A0A835EXE0_9POAL|nr:hypothetical protein HU200_022783 [Digitaria exilis]
MIQGNLLILTPFVVLRHTSLTPAQEKTVDEKVKTIQSDVPIFVANMSKKIVGDDGTLSLDFSSRYATPHLPDGKQTLKLCQNGWRKTWLTKMLNQRMLPGEWREFVRDNRLCTGDICLFEPMKDESPAMAVHIIRSEQCGSNMRKPGKGCTERDACYFWNDYTEDQDKHFFKVLIGDFQKKLVSNFLAYYIGEDVEASSSWQDLGSDVPHSGVRKMRKPGKRCKERDACSYPSYSDVQERYFFKVMTGDFREQLGIPDKFVQHFGDRIAKTVKLESRIGYTFDVEVTRSLRKIVLKTGWKAFVCAHDLKMGDFLVFRYNGTSRLKVLIFDISCCEKMSPRLVARSPVRGRGKREGHIDISNSCDDLAMKLPGSKRKDWEQREASMNVNNSPSTLPSGSSGYEAPY